VEVGASAIPQAAREPATSELNAEVFIGGSVVPFHRPRNCEMLRTRWAALSVAGSQ